MFFYATIKATKNREVQTPDDAPAVALVVDLHNADAVDRVRLDVAPAKECLEKARKSKGLERSFKQSFPEEV